MALPNMFFVPQTLEDADLSVEKKLRRAPEKTSLKPILEM